MQIIRNFTHGIFTVLRLTGTPLLYRYPYRNSAEALRSDWLKVGNDMSDALGRMEKEDKS